MCVYIVIESHMASNMPVSLPIVTDHMASRVLVLTSSCAHALTRPHATR